MDALTGFGSNPGALRAVFQLPEQPRGAPLVVVLHGCTQTAAIYDRGSGWSTLARHAGFALLFPEQRQANNDNLCFNWFQPGDNRRDQGEPLSIRQMIEHVVGAYSLDRGRIFITGLSAGGAMSSVMLAAYPELFNGGAILAGLPFGGVASVTEALERMAGRRHPSTDALAAFVRKASPHTGKWPRISVWHGTADEKVHPSNANAIVEQWRRFHELDATPTSSASNGRSRHRLWRDASGDAVLEEVIIEGMGHGTPIDAASGLGVADTHALDVGVSSTQHIARFWGIA